jgi:hypothetical protein
MRLKDPSVLNLLRDFVLMDLLVANSRKRRRKPATLALS